MSINNPFTEMQLAEKYRPRRFEDIREQEQIISSIIEILHNGRKSPNLMLLGPAGTGKTTLIQIYAQHYLGADYPAYYTELNGSDNRKIDDIRNKVKPMAESQARRVIFFTEADGLTPDSQQALRRIMEKSQNTVFVFDLNNENKIIKPIMSRCTVFRFKPISDVGVIKTLIGICEKEGVQINGQPITLQLVAQNPELRAGFEQIAKVSRGDLRGAINELEKIIKANKEINAKNVIEQVKSNLVIDSVNLALQGDWIAAKNAMQDAFLTSGQNSEAVFGQLVEAVKQIKDETVQVKLCYELGTLDHHLQTTRFPLVSFTSFIAYIRLLPHLKMPPR